MKITVAKSDLEAALQVVTHAMSTSGTDIASHFVFRRVSDDRVEVLTYSGRLFSSCPFPATVEGDMPFTLEGKRLKQWIRSISDTNLVLEYDDTDKVVTASVSKGSQEFQSLDPKSFPYWDDLSPSMTKTSDIDASRLGEALEYSKFFVADSKMESSEPKYCVTEMRAGVLYSSNKRATSVVKVNGLDKSNFRIFVTEIGSVLKFLSSVPSGETVEILEHDRGVVFKRGDGAVFGETKYQASLPAAALPLSPNDEFWWELPKEELRASLSFLMSGADADDNRIWFQWGGGQEPVRVSMEALTKKRKSLEMHPVASGQKVVGETLPEFLLSVESLQKIINAWRGTNIRFGVNRRKGSGFVLFLEERGGDQYLTATPWLRQT